MTDKLERPTVANLRALIERNPLSAHAAGARQVLRKWLDESGLQMDAETKTLLEETLRDFPPES